ncbi:MAG: carboxylating nicotinate-nucleotide diphosphorylase [Clostridiales bacterium]|jgi:nicotinate-nucleotide pyrophosphorylase (carboxylating)|nr:carboxylating nicotinate-nucleotide diphosphorylase [Clostridiales bacterium]
MLDYKIIDKIIENSLFEDMPFGDITTDNIIPDGKKANANFIAKATGILAGIDVAGRVFRNLDNNSIFTVYIEDGFAVRKGDTIAMVTGEASAILKAERTALNILQRMSGVATRTNSLCKLIKGKHAKLVDTRKTTPGLRYLEKYAVSAGGGQNHRFSLSDGVLIKDNHIAAAGGIKAAVEAVRGKIPHTVKIEVEVENMEMIKEAVEAKADIIMFDNMGVGQMKEAVAFIAGRALTEASGDIDEERIIAVADTGVDIISVGRITHSVKSLDISLKFV